VTQTIASAGPARELPARDDSGGTWVRDGGCAPAGRVMGKERSKRRRLLNAARASLERAQARVAETGEDLKKKSHRGAIEASGKIARGVRKLLPQSGESITGYHVTENTRRLADFTACQAEVARIRDLRCAQQQAGRYDGRQPRVPNVAQPSSADSQADSPPRQGPRARVNALHARVAEEAREAAAYEAQHTSTPDEPEAARGRDESMDEARSSSNSLTFDLVSDEELLFAYQTALDELEVAEKSEDSDETEIIALAVSGMHLHVELVAFAISRLYELVGLDPHSMPPDVESEDQRQVVATERTHNIRQDTCERADEDTADEYISGNSLCPALALRIAGLP
jgi:hypothetical protein